MNTSKYSDVDGKMVEEYRMARVKHLEERITEDVENHTKLL